jgi:hypothetical protein
MHCNKGYAKNGWHLAIGRTYWREDFRGLLRQGRHIKFINDDELLKNGESVLNRNLQNSDS